MKSVFFGMIMFICLCGLFLRRKKTEEPIEVSSESPAQSPLAIESPLTAIKDGFKQAKDAIQNQDFEFIEGNAYKLLNRLSTTGKDRVDDFLRDRAVSKTAPKLKTDNNIPIDNIIPRLKTVRDMVVLKKKKEDVVRMSVEEDKAKSDEVKRIANDSAYSDNSIFFDQRFM